MRDDIRLIPTTEYRNSIVAAVWNLVSAELLLLAWFCILSSEFADWTPNRTGVRTIQVILVLLIVLPEVAAPLCGRFRVPVYVGIELAGLAVSGLYCWRHMDSLREGFTQVFDDYLAAWNACYHTNYIGWDAGADKIGYVLTVVTAVLLFVFLILRCLTGVRFILLVPPLAAVGLGLLVDVQPDWKSLALLLAGAVSLYCGEWETSKILFCPVQNGKRSRLTPFVRQLGTVVFVSLVIGISSIVFAAPAAKIPEKMPAFLAFQKNLEDKLQRVGSTWFESNREYVDNTTPEYNDTLVAQIEADVKPDSNLYLADFYSGTYRNGRWKQDTSSFENAAGADGIDSEALGTLLRQMSYEYLCRSQVVSSEALSAYTISYYIKGSRAWMPYFSDVTSAGDDVWVDGEGLVRKKRSTDSISFVGWNQNDILSLDGQSALSQKEEDAADWYSAYVQEHYLDSANLTAVSEAADEIYEIYVGAGWHDSKGNYDYGDLQDDEAANVYRCLMAATVQEWLAETADYNLYLDDIPSGTDTIAYFLETGHEGYCMHFASAGVLILQELGIPARYASGYIVKMDAFHLNGGQYEADIYDRNGHAWAEIYLEGIGWVPFEMTPGYSVTSDSLPTDASGQEALQEKHTQKTQEESQAGEDSQTESPSEADNSGESESEELQAETSQAEEPQDEMPSTQIVSGTGTEDGEYQADIGTKNSVNWAKVCRTMGILLAAVALLGLIWTIIRRKMRQYREVLLKEMRRQHYRPAVRRINRRIYRRLRRDSILPLKKARLHKFGDSAERVSFTGLTDAQYERRLAEAYPAVSQEQWAYYMEIVKKCAFSVEEISREEAEHCYRIYRQVCGRQ